MISQLTIRDFAIVERLTIDWAPGLNVVTGETGAGKSIIIDAVGSLLGGRVSPDFVRTGAQRAVVEGVFVLDSSAVSVSSDRTPSAEQAPSELAAVLEEYGLDVEDGALILTREVAGVGGRGVARVNGRAVPTTVLQQVGEHLVDIHGQSEHLSLLRPREHLELLDRYAGLGPERARLARLVGELREAERDARRLREDARQAEREQGLLRHEVEQIDAAGLHPGEEEELTAARGRLRNVERLRAAVAGAYATLTGDEDRPGATDLLGQAAGACATGADFDPDLGAEAEALEGATAQAEESARALRQYLERIEEDPEQLQEIEERLLLIGDLKRRFGDQIEEVLAYAEHARARLQAVERQDQLLAELADRRDRLRRDVGSLAGELSARRAIAAERLRASVEAELADLNMRGTRFVVEIEQRDDPNGVPVGPDGAAPARQFDGTGIDRVEFLIAPNLGEEPKGLGRIASGGELSRVSLALKTVLSRVDRRASLIFDEIDAGVGGRSASVVGQKLWGLTRDGGHQVLCVTHMPQVAAYADAHLVVSKDADDGSSRVVIRELRPEERVDELAQMLGGVHSSRGARVNAEELLAAATTWKQAQGGKTSAQARPVTAEGNRTPVEGRKRPRSAIAG